MERYYNENGNLVVLVSPGYGAGWSTWNDDACAYQKDIVKYFVENHPTKEEMEEFMHKLGYGYVCMGGYDQLKAVSIPRGTRFQILEYGGFEYIKAFNESEWNES